MSTRKIQMDWINDDLEEAFYYIETDTAGGAGRFDLELLIRENKNNPIGQILSELEKITEF